MDSRYYKPPIYVQQYNQSIPLGCFPLFGKCSRNVTVKVDRIVKISAEDFSTTHAQHGEIYVTRTVSVKWKTAFTNFTGIYRKEVEVLERDSYKHRSER